MANEIAGQDSTRNGFLDTVNDAFCNSGGDAEGGNPYDTQDDLLQKAGIPAAKAGLATGISRVMSRDE